MVQFPWTRLCAPVAQGKEQLPSKQRVGGSNPSGRARPYVARFCDASSLSETAEKANAHPLADGAEAFLLTKRVGGCTEATLRIYQWWLRRLQAEVSEVTPLALRAFFVGLHHRSASTSTRRTEPSRRSSGAWRPGCSLKRRCVGSRCARQKRCRRSLRRMNCEACLPSARRRWSAYAIGHYSSCSPIAPARE